MPTNLLRTLAWAGAVLLACSGAAWADPPARVARLGYTSGAVSFSPAGETGWDSARTNRPLGAGDRLWTDPAARAEIELGGAQIRLGGATGASLLQLDDRNLQLQLTQGTLNLRVRRLDRGQVFEVDTPQIAFTINQPADYRIEVEPNGQATRVTVRQGQGEAYADGLVQVIDARQAYRFSGNGLAGLEPVSTPATDAFDRWAAGRDRSYDSSSSARYVSPDVVGYQDLDATAAGAPTRTTARSGCPSGWPPTGRPTATATGPGSTPGAGPGLMTRPGATPSRTTAAGPGWTTVGPGCPARSAARLTTPRRWWRLSVAATSGSASAPAMCPAWPGSRWRRARSTGRPMPPAAGTTKTSTAATR